MEKSNDEMMKSARWDSTDELAAQGVALERDCSYVETVMECCVESQVLHSSCRVATVDKSSIGGPTNMFAEEEVQCQGGDILGIWCGRKNR